MELEYLKSCLKKRVNLTRLYPQLKGRHDFFNDHLEKVNEGIELLEMAYRLTQKGKDYLNQLGKKIIESHLSDIFLLGLISVLLTFKSIKCQLSGFVVLLYSDSYSYRADR